MDDLVLKVAANSNPKNVAGAIAKSVRAGNKVEMIAMGPQAVNQAVKAMAISSEYLVREAKDLIFKPEFMHLNIEGEQKSAIKFVVLTRELL
jgi:stage V sporulation protein S